MIGQSQLRHPLAQRPELALPSWQSTDDRVPVGRSHHSRWRLPHGSVAKGVPLHGRLGHEPFIRRRLSRDVARSMHAHVDKLPDALRLLHVESDERSFDGPQARRVISLIATWTNGWETVVVVPTAPHRPRAGLQRQVGDRLARPGVRTTEGGDGHPDQPEAVGVERLVVKSQVCEQSGRFTLQHHVAGLYKALEEATPPVRWRSSVTLCFPVL